MDTDGAGDSGETRWINTNWTKWYGLYKQIPELQEAINTKATWTVGKGFIADETTTFILDSIKGLTGIQGFQEKLREYTVLPVRHVASILR